jgi:subtilisin family serine protease
MRTFSFFCFIFALSFFYSTSSSLSLSDGPKTFIVHVANSHKPSLFTSTHNWHESLLHALPSSTHQPSILYSYHHAVSGFSAHITAQQATVLRSVPAVISVVPDQIRQIHTTHTPQFLKLTENSGLWSNSHQGNGVIIGVLDTGIWPERRSFSDDGLNEHVPSTWKGECEISRDFPATGCNNKIIGAKAFYRGYESYLGGPIDETKESKSPRDTEGHGTHTASTAAGSIVKNASFLHYASGEARGMASNARVAAYKICWAVGCFDSDMLAAMDQAIADGVDVISLSVGSNGYAPQYDDDSIAIGAFGAVKNGIVVSCSAGNSGPDQYSATNIAPWITTVGASTVDREFPAEVILGDGRIFNGVSLYYSDNSDSLPESSLPLVYAKDAGYRYCYLGSLDSSKVEGKIVVCDRGGNARVEKGSAVKLAGGLGMIMANTDANGEELIADSHLIPGTMVGAKAGNSIKEYIRTNQFPTATIEFKGTVIGPTPPAPKVASFSSRGPNSVTPEILKPDVIAPGVNILAGWTGATSPTDLDIDPRRTEFNIISGTSMSCPHVSGLSALLKSAHPDWSPAEIKSALMTTAYNLDNSGNEINDLASGHESTPFVRGAGHVDPNSALNPGLVYDINTSDYISFLCSIGYDSKRISVFTRRPSGADVCETKLSSPGNLNYPSFSVVFRAKGEAVTYKRVVKNVGDSVDAVYDVKVDAPANVHVSVSPSKLEFNAKNQTLSYEITFTSVLSGLVGDSLSKFGWIEWSDGVHNVRSPIAVRWALQGLSESI